MATLVSNVFNHRLSKQSDFSPDFSCTDFENGLEAEIQWIKEIQ